MSTLGNYEMVMALSESTVNVVFQSLKEHGKIHDVWSTRIATAAGHRSRIFRSAPSSEVAKTR